MICFATLLLCAAQDAPPAVRYRVAPPREVPLSQAAASAVDAYSRPIRARLDALEAEPHDAPNLLARRVALAEAARAGLSTFGRLAGPDRAAAETRAFNVMAAVDDSNTAFLTRIWADGDMLRTSLHGAARAHDAWLVVQHASDPAVQRVALARMEVLMSEHDANPKDYALLLDRVHLQDGKGQTYGSQLTCVEGRYSPTSLVDPQGVDARRAAVGLPPLADYLKRAPSSC